MLSVAINPGQKSILMACVEFWLSLLKTCISCSELELLMFFDAFMFFLLFVLTRKGRRPTERHFSNLHFLKNCSLFIYRIFGFHILKYFLCLLALVSRIFVKWTHLGFSSISIAFELLLGCYNSPEENSARVTDWGGPIKPENYSPEETQSLSFIPVWSTCSWWLCPRTHSRCSHQFSGQLWVNWSVLSQICLSPCLF